MVKDKDMQFCMKNLKMKRKRTNPKIFSNFYALDLNLRMTRSNQGNLLQEIGL